MADLALSVRVTGLVQGVWFRGWTAGKARELGLSGWVRNEADGSVRGLISGPEAAVRAMLAALHDGPQAARVTRVESAAAEAPAEDGFRILR
jgi:acylphosphatase